MNLTFNEILEISGISPRAKVWMLSDYNFITTKNQIANLAFMLAGLHESASQECMSLAFSYILDPSESNRRRCETKHTTEILTGVNGWLMKCLAQRDLKEAHANMRWIINWSLDYPKQIALIKTAFLTK